ncbi:MAG: hypothetical protein ACRD8O_15085 [Bryobacteraceae bacterium]
MEFRNLLAYGSGAGIEIRQNDLSVTLTRVRPSRVEAVATAVIEDFRKRPAAEWGSEYTRFLREHGLGYLTATVVLPRAEVIIRQISLPGVDKRDIAAAIGFQLDVLHPFGDEEVVYAWERLSAAGAVLVGIVRKSTLEAYTERFVEAGVGVASFTFSASLLHSAFRLLAVPPAEGFVAIGHGESGAIEVYGESPSRPVFSAEFDSPAERAVALAAAELRLPDSRPVTIPQLLPIPAGAEVSGHTLSYSASLAAACPRLACPANLLPAERRSTNSRAMFIPSAVLAVILLLTAGGMYGYSVYSERQYRATLHNQIQPLEIEAQKVAAVDRAIEQARARSRLLAEFRGRTKSDLDALNDLTRILAPPIWTSNVQLTRDAVSIGGEAEQAAPLLKIIDGSPHFRDSAFALAIAKAQNAELFRIRAAREGK